MKLVKKRISVFFAFFATAVCGVALCACGGKTPTTDNPPPSDAEYKVAYSCGAAGDSGIKTESYKAGTEITVAHNTVEYADHTFKGWKTGVDIYMPGEIYIVPASDTLFTAVWKDVEYSYPAFRQQSYAYDRWGAGELELTLDLDGSNLCYVEIDGSTLFSTEWRYDQARGCLVIVESYALSLADGEYTVVAITDAAEGGDVSCKLTVDNSVKTAFDEVRTKTFRYGYDEGAAFALDKGMANVTSVMCGGNVVDEKYYTVTDDSLIVSGEFMKHFAGDTKFTVKLDNYDSYEFTIKPTNIIFASDYDLNTIHDTKASNSGENSLYQYYDNVSIVESPAAMNSGKALKITPNTTVVPLDCNGYFTLRTQAYEHTKWYNGTFVPGKNYFISFDYMTENTSVGTLVYKDPHSGWTRTLLMGAENDGVAHHFSATVNGNELQHGLYLYAYFPNGGGNVYVDNFLVAEIDIPQITAGEYRGVGDYSFTLDGKGMSYELLLDGEKIDADKYEYNGTAHTCKIASSVMTALGYGRHTLSVKTVFCTVDAALDVIDGRVAEISTARVAYASETDSEVKVYGSFSEGLTLTSLVQKAKTYNKSGASAVYGEWNFCDADTTKNYKDTVSLTYGDENDGYITLPKEFLDLFWGETEFEVAFDNGKHLTFTLVSDVLFFSNYDDTTIFGYQGDSAVVGSPLNSGLNNGSIGGIESYGEDGNNAFVIRQTSGAESPSAYTVRFRDHQWGWFYTKATPESWLRITFDYQICGLAENSVYFYLMGTRDEDLSQVFLGDYDEVATPDWIEVRYHLQADGKKHTFDSGWFRYPDDSIDCRMTRIALPYFDQADGRYAVFDNYRIVQKASVTGNFLTELKYDLVFDENLEIAIPDGVTAQKATVGNTEVTLSMSDGKAVISGAALEAVGKGLHTFKLYTDCGVYRTNLTVTEGGVAVLTEKSKNVVYNSGSVKLAGEFTQGVTVTSLKRRSNDYWDNTNPAGGCAVKTDGTMKTSYITVQPDGIVLSAALVDSVYMTETYTVEFSNGAVETFTLTSNIIRYSDYDENYLHQENGVNVESFQDTNMISIVKDSDGNTVLKYQPENAQEWHSKDAINGGNPWNGILTFANERFVPNEWWHYPFAEGSTVIVFFDYEVYDPDNKANYCFNVIDLSGTYHPTKLTGKGHFSVEINSDEMARFVINCPVATPNNVTGTYMTVDNFGFGVKVA